MRKYQLILIACLSVAAGQCWADEDKAQAPPDPAVFCYLKGVDGGLNPRLSGGRCRALAGLWQKVPPLAGSGCGGELEVVSLLRRSPAG
jgi:hypothetical protein